MSVTGIPAFDRTIRRTTQWLNDITERLGTGDRDAAYAALRGTLHALRDSLSVEDAAKLAGRLPTLARGIFYEGWEPAGLGAKPGAREDFLPRLRTALGDRQDIGPEEAAHAVFGALAGRLSPEEARGILGLLPMDVKELWPAKARAVEAGGDTAAPLRSLHLWSSGEAPVEVGTCAMCERRPADYLGLICTMCSEAVESNEPWTLAFDDVLSQLRDLEEAEEQYR